MVRSGAQYMYKGTEETGSVQPGKETLFSNISLLFILR